MTKTIEEVGAIMSRLPEAWRHRWCGGENGGCACLGCVQIGCRALMAEEVSGRPYRGDPERIDENKIPDDVFAKFRPTKEEWQSWMAAQG